MKEHGGNDVKGMVNDNEGVRSLGGREMPKSRSISIRDGICVCVVVVVVVAVVLLLVVVWC